MTSKLRSIVSNWGYVPLKIYKITFLSLFGSWLHTCVFDVDAVLHASVGVAISGSEGCVHTDDVTMPTGLDSLHTVSLSRT